MSALCIGFICAVLLSALITAWIAYCMFFRERHISEKNQVDIEDLRIKNQIVAENHEVKKENSSGLSAGIFILPSRRKHRDDYESRPDYPEGPSPNVQKGTEELFKGLFDDSKSEPIGAKDVSFEIESNSQYHSDV